jgi:hypothetical protein
LQQQEEQQQQTNKNHKKPSLPPVVVPSSLRQATQQKVMMSGGSLLDKLSLEKPKLISHAHRFSRFAGNYRQEVKGFVGITPVLDDPFPPTPSVAPVKPVLSTGINSSSIKQEEGKEAEKEPENLGRVVNSSALLMSHPFGKPGDSLPQVKSKRNKKNITCIQENSLITDSSLLHQSSKITVESQQACVVVASVVDMLTSEACFKSFVRRVNEDLRRDELRISNELELNYFTILTKFLHYNRLKLTDSYQQHKQEKKTKPMTVWQPNLLNVIDCLDKMSFTRVVFSMERLQKPTHKDANPHENLWIPMNLYYEMLCYLEILLLSDIEGHHEIAIGALYRLFYTTTEKLDPLGKLLSNWKTGFYCKKHLDLLISVFEQTMKTLEAAKDIFSNEGITSEEALKLSRQKKGKKDKKEMDMEQYLLTSLRFDNLEYFRRFISNHFIADIFVRLLKELENNDKGINAVLWSICSRLKNFQLEKTSDATTTTNTLLAFFEEEEQVKKDRNSMRLLETLKPHPVNLSFLLLNLHSFVIIEGLLSNSAHLLRFAKMNRDDSIPKILKYLKELIHFFGVLSNKNQLMFLEILFRHPRVQEHCLSLENVYDASIHAVRDFSSSVSGGPASFSLERSQQQEDEETSADSGSDDSEREGDGGRGKVGEGEDEFDENAYPNISITGTKDNNKDKDRKKKKKKTKRTADSSDDSEADNVFDGFNQQREKMKTRRRASTLPWTDSEDSQLRKWYKKYAGSAAVFSNIVR